MSLADRLAERLAPIQVPCPLPEVFAGLDDRDAAALREALKPQVMGNKELRDHLLAEGYVVSDSALRRHKKGACACRLPIAS